MKLYRIDATKDDAKDDFSEWVGTQSAAATIRKDLNSRRGYKRDAILTHEIEVPTNKAGLIEFLNNL